MASLLARTGVPPNVITWSALALNLWACIFFAAGRFAAAGGLIILAGLCDLLDGPVARRQNRVSKFGGFLESILDRYSDLMLFLGLLVYYVRVNRFPYAILAGTAMAGAVMVSYARARAESLGPTSEVGFWERPERMVLMIVGALANQMGLTLWILAIGPNISVIHRIVHTWQQTEGKLRRQRALDGAGVSSSGLPATTPPETGAILSRSAGRGS
jgi:CDP-diacylglycerol--glycerol-3-phosphate 3-phosphatidyltransferase